MGRRQPHPGTVPRTRGGHSVKMDTRLSQTVSGGHFERLFRTQIPARDNFRSRLFGLFSEEIVRAWGRNEQAAYRDIGRPTLWQDDRFATLDFTLERRRDGARFVPNRKRSSLGLATRSYGSSPPLRSAGIAADAHSTGSSRWPASRTG